MAFYFMNLHHYTDVTVIAPIGGKKPKPNMNANTIAQVKRCLLELAACAPMIFPPN